LQLRIIFCVEVIMKKHLVLFAFPVVFVFCFSPCIYADTVRYIATNLIDNHDNPASGYLEINKTFSYSGSIETIGIEDFEFSSYDSSTDTTFSNSGSGSITGILDVDYYVDGVKVLERDPQNAIIYLDGSPYSWGYRWGIYFLDSSKKQLALTDANYSTPPPYFIIADWEFKESDWYIKSNSNNGWMMFQAVPIPPAFLLFGSGLLSLLMVKRKKA